MISRIPRNIFLSINAIAILLIWLPQNLISSRNRIYYPNHDGDQVIYISRARSEWDSMDITAKFIQNKQSFDGTLSLFEKLFFGIPSNQLHSLLDFKTYLMIVVLGTFSLFLWTTWRFTELLSISTWHRAWQATFFIYCTEFQYIITSHDNRESIITKWPFPALHYVLVLETIMVLYRISNKGANFNNLCLFLFLLVLGMNIYFFSWQIQLLISTSAILYFAKRRDKEKFQKVLVIFLLFCTFSLIKFRNLIFGEMLNSNLYYYSIERILSHDYILPKSLLVVLMGIVALIYRGEKTHAYGLFFVWISTLILFNQQVLTGTLVQPGHILWYWTIPMFGLIVSKVFVPNLTNDSKRISFYTLSAVIMIPVFFTLSTITYMTSNKVMIESSELVKLNTLNGKVIFSDGGILDGRILVETNNKLFWHPISKFYPKNDLASLRAAITFYLWNELKKDLPNVSDFTFDSCQDRELIACEIISELRRSENGVWRRAVFSVNREKGSQTETKVSSEDLLRREIQGTNLYQYINIQLRKAKVEAFILKEQPSVGQIRFMKKYCNIEKVDIKIWRCI